VCSRKSDVSWGSKVHSESFSAFWASKNGTWTRMGKRSFKCSKGPKNSLSAFWMSQNRLW
jgi:hypothetical protein